MAELVQRELAPYATRNYTEINGPKVVLTPEAGQAVAMVLHELTTNAAKYGALSTGNGRVSIRWDRRPNGHSRSHLVFEWQEVGGPAVEAMQRTGTPPPRTVIGDPSRACRQGRNRRVFCDRVPPFSVRDGGRRPRVRRRRARGATRRWAACGPRRRSSSCARCGHSWCELQTMAKVLSF